MADGREEAVETVVAQPEAGVAQTVWTSGHGNSAAQGAGNQLNLFVASGVPAQAEPTVLSGEVVDYAPAVRIAGAPAVWNVDSRNPGFSGREAELAQLRRQLTDGGAAAVQALYGMGGIGKSQLAIEYAHRHADAYDVVWWISAEAGLIGEQYTALGSALGLIASDADSILAARVVKAHLRARDRWLLIFDNAESADDIREWLPGGAGHVIITSRHQRWAQLAVTTEVDVLTRAESIQLLTDLHPRLAPGEASDLAETLGDLPLALVQAGGFLAETGMPTTGYLQALSAQATEVLGEGRPVSYPQPLAAAIAISTNRLADVDPAALAILRLCAFLAPEPVPVELLVAIVQADHETPDDSAGIAPLAAVMDKPLARARSVGRIADYGLAKATRDGITVHRLTQAVLRDQVSPTVANHLRARIQAVLAVTEPGNPRDSAAWPMWAQLLPQLLATDPAHSANPDVRVKARNAVVYLLSRGDARPAQGLADDLYQSWRAALGPDHADTLAAATELVWAHRDLGKIHELRPLVEDTLARQDRTLGEDHPDTLRSASDLAVVFSELGEYRRALQIDEDVVARRRRVLGDDHPDTLTSVGNFASTLEHLGELKRGRHMHEDVLARRRRVLGDDHPDTLTSAGSLANALSNRGEFERGRQMHEDVLARRRRVLGDDHPATLTSADNLASTLGHLGEHEHARQLHDDVLARRRRVLGDDHPATLTSAANLASTLDHLGEFERARQMHEDVLARRRRVLGHDHPDTLSSAANLATALGNLGEHEHARQMHEDVLARRRRVLGDDHPDTLTSAANLAITVGNLGDHKRAQQMEEDVLARRRRVLGDDHPHTLTSAANLADTLMRLGQKMQARPLADQAFRGFRRVLGNDHPSTRIARRRLDAIVLAMGGNPGSRRNQRHKR